MRWIGGCVLDDLIDLRHRPEGGRSNRWWAGSLVMVHRQEELAMASRVGSDVLGGVNDPLCSLPVLSRGLRVQTAGRRSTLSTEEGRRSAAAPGPGSSSSAHGGGAAAAGPSLPGRWWCGSR